MKIITSKKFTLDFRDYAKGLLLAAGTSVGTVVQRILDTWINSPDTSAFSNINWKTILMAAVAGAGTYLITNFLSPSKVIVKTELPVDVIAVKNGEVQENEKIS